MRFKFMQLGKNLITGEDNEKDSWDRIKDKLEEEYKELTEAIEEKNLINIALETFDVIQVCIRSLVLLRKNGVNLEQANKRHNRKLVKRMWKSVREINVIWK